MFHSRFPFIAQKNSADCGAACLEMILRYNGGRLNKGLFETDITGVSMKNIMDAAKVSGLEARLFRLDLKTLREKFETPAILHWKDNHFVVLSRVASGYAYISDPAFGPAKLDWKEFSSAWGEEGIALFLKRGRDFKKIRGMAGLDAAHVLPLIGAALREKRLPLIGISCGIALALGLQLLLPFMTRGLVDRAVLARQTNTAFLFLLAILAFSFFRSLSEIVRGFMVVKVGAHINATLVHKFLDKIMRIPFSFFRKRRISDVLQGVTEHYRIEGFLLAHLPTLIISVISIAALSIVLLGMAWKTFLMFMLFSLAYGAVLVPMLSARKYLDNERYQSAAESQEEVIHIVQGIHEIKLAGAQAERLSQWERKNDRVIYNSIRSSRLAYKQELYSSVISELRNFAVMAFLVTDVINGRTTLGTMFAIQALLAQLHGPIQSLVHVSMAFQDFLLSLGRIEAVHAEEDEHSGRDPGILGHFRVSRAIQLSDLTFSYNGTNGLRALDNISLSIPVGKVTAIVGESGSGKSTLLKVLMGLETPQQGRIFIGEKPLDDFQLSGWRSLCGAVLQDGYLFPFSIAENVAMHSGVVDERKILGNLDKMNLSETIRALPKGIWTEIGANGVRFSAGQVQRLLIARALYKDPEILFLDEATNSLDAENEWKITEFIREHFAGKTVVTIAHRLSTVYHADQIIVLKNGGVIERGTHAELLGGNGHYKNLVKHQILQ